MITLCMDTSHKLLALSIIEDDKVIASYQEICLKKQSELIFDKLNEICKIANIKPFDIDEVVISKGPGSYTGVRIAMSVAKVMCSIRNIPLYTLDTLRLYAGDIDNVSVIMDARGNRVYYGEYNKGDIVVETCVKEIDDIKDFLDEKNIVGDLSVFGKNDIYNNLSNNFISLKKFWEKVDNIHLLVPTYLKEASEYLVKK